MKVELGRLRSTAQLRPDERNTAGQECCQPRIVITRFQLMIAH